MISNIFYVIEKIYKLFVGGSNTLSSSGGIFGGGSPLISTPSSGTGIFGGAASSTTTSSTSSGILSFV